MSNLVTSPQYYTDLQRHVAYQILLSLTQEIRKRQSELQALVDERRTEKLRKDEYGIYIHDGNYKEIREQAIKEQWEKLVP